MLSNLQDICWLFCKQIHTPIECTRREYLVSTGVSSCQYLILGTIGIMSTMLYTTSILYMYQYIYVDPSQFLDFTSKCNAFVSDLDLVHDLDFH